MAVTPGLFGDVDANRGRAARRGLNADFMRESLNETDLMGWPWRKPATGRTFERTLWTGQGSSTGRKLPTNRFPCGKVNGLSFFHIFQMARYNWSSMIPLHWCAMELIIFQFTLSNDSFLQTFYRLNHFIQYISLLTLIIGEVSLDNSGKKKNKYYSKLTNTTATFRLNRIFYCKWKR